VKKKLGGHPPGERIGEKETKGKKNNLSGKKKKKMVG